MADDPFSDITAPDEGKSGGDPFGDITAPEPEQRGIIARTKEGFQEAYQPIISADKLVDKEKHPYIHKATQAAIDANPLGWLDKLQAAGTATIAGAVPGMIAGAAENEAAATRAGGSNLPNISAIPRVSNENEATRFQRDAAIIGQGLMIEPGMGLAAVKAPHAAEGVAPTGGEAVLHDIVTGKPTPAPEAAPAPAARAPVYDAITGERVEHLPEAAPEETSHPALKEPNKPSLRADSEVQAENATRTPPEHDPFADIQEEPPAHVTERIPDEAQPAGPPEEAAPTPQEAPPEPAGAPVDSRPGMMTPPDPLDLAMSGQLTPERAKQIGQDVRRNQEEIENSIFGDKKTADEWRKLHRMSDRAWDKAKDARAREIDRQIEDLEARVGLTEKDQNYLDGKDWPDHSDPQQWADLSRNLHDISMGREDALQIAASELRYLPAAGDWSKMAGSQRQSLITILTAMNEEVKAGRDPQAFLRDLAKERIQRYGGGPDAIEATKGQMEQLAGLVRSGIQREGPPPPEIGRAIADSRKKEKPPETLSQYIARNGGLELTPEARDMGLHKRFIPGAGNVARKNGKSLDGFWRERLMEAGYLDKDPDGYMSRDIRGELYDKLGGAEPAYSKFDRAPEPQMRGRDREIETHAKSIVDAFEKEGLPKSELDTKVLYDAADRLYRGEAKDPFEAYDRAVMEEERNAQRGGVRGTGQEVHPAGSERAGPGAEKAVPVDRPLQSGLGPVERVSEAPVSAKAVGRKSQAMSRVSDEITPAEHYYQRGLRAGQVGKKPARPSDPHYMRGYSAGRRLSEAVTEPGAEGKPQGVLPGAERVTAAEIAKRKVAERQAQEKMRAKVSQKAADEGLFGDEIKQMELSWLTPEKKPDQGLIQREDVVRGPRSGRPIKSRKIPIGTEEAILEKGYEKATGEKGAPREPGIEPMGRTSGGLSDAERLAANKKMLASIRKTIADPFERKRDPAKVAHLESQIPSLEAEIAQLEKKLAAGSPPPSPPPSGPPSQPPAPKRPRFIATKRLAHSYKETFQPELISEDALKADPLFAKYASVRAGEHDRIIREGNDRYKRWNKVPEAQRIDFMSKLERGEPVELQFRGIAQVYRKMLNKAHEMEKQWGSKAGYVEDYFPHLWERPAPGQAPLASFIDARIQALGPTWFQKARTFDLIEEGLRAGYRLKSTNPEQLMNLRLMSGADMRARMQLLNNLKELGMADKVAGGDRRTHNWEKINAPDREQWRIAPDVTALWKNGVQSEGFWSHQGLAGDVFRGWMGFKNAWIPVKLALSAFHPLHVYHINFASSMARAADQILGGRPLDGLKSIGQSISPYQGIGKRARAQWLLGEEARTPEGKFAVKTMEEGGFTPMLSEQLRIDAGRKFSDALQTRSPIKLGYHGLRLGIQKMQGAIFEHWIPHLKAAAYLNDTAALLKRQPELMNDKVARGVALRAVAKSIDNRFGEMFYGSLFWNRYAKDASIGSFLSLGWNLGFAREFGGAAMESVTRPAGELSRLVKGKVPSETRMQVRDATNKIKFATIYMGTAALIGAAMTKYFTGEDPQQGADYIFPRVEGVNPDGSPRRLTTMFYLREGPMLAKHVQEYGGGISGTLSGTGAMIWNKLLFQPITELWNNRNYYGSEIWDDEAPGYEQFTQALQHIVSSQLSPMSVSGAQRARDTGGKPYEEGLAYLGFGPAPAYAERTAIQNRITHLYQQFVSPLKRSYEEEATTKDRMKARADILMAKQKGDPDEIQRTVDVGREAGLSQKYINELGKVSTDQRMFRRLAAEAPPKALSILKQATDEERARYLPFASTKVKAQWYAEHPRSVVERADGGTVEDDGDVNDMNSPAFKKAVNQALATGQDAIAAPQKFYPNVKINPEAWDEHVKHMPESLNIEDRRPGYKGGLHQAVRRHYGYKQGGLA